MDATDHSILGHILVNLYFQHIAENIGIDLCYTVILLIMEIYLRDVFSPLFISALRRKMFTSYFRFTALCKVNYTI